MTGHNLGQGGLPEDPQGLQVLLLEAYKPTDVTGVEALESVVEAYVAWRRVGQMAWGETGHSAEVGQAVRVRRAAARNLLEALHAFRRCLRAHRGRALRSQPVGLALRACAEPEGGCAPWAWAVEPGELEAQLLDLYRPTDPVEAMVISLVAEAYGDAQWTQGRPRERVGDLIGEWQRQPAQRQAARHLGEMLRVLQRLRAERRRPAVEVVGVRCMAGGGSCAPAEGPV